MPIIAKDLVLKKRKKVPEFVGHRQPDRDKNCPICAQRGRETQAFAYKLTVGGKSLDYLWCPFCQAER